MKEAERLRQTRAIRTRIARLRRNLDGDVQMARREGRRLTSWKTIARRFPGSALLAAFGTGLALSAGLSGRWLTAWFGRRLFTQAARRMQKRFFVEIANFVESLFDRNADTSRRRAASGRGGEGGTTDEA